MRFTLSTGHNAIALLADESFRTEWANLFASCSWATPYQSYDFAASWYAAYFNVMEPVIAIGRRADGSLASLLAGARTATKFSMVGGHQAEYSCWLCERDDLSNAFDGLLDALEGEFGRLDLLLRYLPPSLPVDELCTRSKHRRRLMAKMHDRPFVHLDARLAEESLKKKGNKSKLNRLKRLGSVEFEVIDDPDRFDDFLVTVSQQYDARQKAVNGAAPFAADPRKHAFHLEMMKRGLLHVSALMVSGRIAAAHIGVRSTSEVHLSIVSFDGALADESPNKLLLLLLFQRLARDGLRRVDLTPGGDAWKNRFATGSDCVHELEIHRSLYRRSLHLLEHRLRKIAKKIFRRHSAASVAT